MIAAKINIEDLLKSLQSQYKNNVSINDCEKTNFLADNKAALAVQSILEEDLFNKAIELLTKDKKVDPSHSYSYMDGSRDNPRYYYTDSFGNNIRYSNAPNGHAERSSYYGEAERHPSEPDFNANPEYFTPDGKKLSRCPDCDAANVEWNQQYNAYDPQNLWAGRWTDPDSGKMFYTYVDSDLRQYSKLGIHHQNALVDTRIPALRQYIFELYSSNKIKDQLTAVALTLLDQGRMRAVELSCLCVNDVRIEGTIVQLGNRKIHADENLRTALMVLTRAKGDDEPLLSVPKQKDDGQFEENITRRIGPHYLANVLDQLGISLIGLQSYHASITFAREVTRLVTQYQAPWEQAVSNAVLAAAVEWGHDLTAEQDVPRTLQLIQSILIDPVLIEAINRNMQEQGMLSEEQVYELPPILIPIPHVTLSLTDRTEEELEFSEWLHGTPLHEYANE